MLTHFGIKITLILLFKIGRKIQSSIFKELIKCKEVNKIGMAKIAQLDMKSQIKLTSMELWEAALALVVNMLKLIIEDAPI